MTFGITLKIFFEENRQKTYNMLSIQIEENYMVTKHKMPLFMQIVICHLM